MIILKQIVKETQKWHYIFSRHSGSWIIDQNMQHLILINNSRTTCWYFNAVFNDNNNNDNNNNNNNKAKSMERILKDRCAFYKQTYTTL